ncbi:MAG: oligosaccharide flippase family protein, partial [Chloroflexota bacterium]
LPVRSQSSRENALVKSMKQLTAYSLALFFQQISARFSQQIDRTVVGLFLGPSTLTFYTVPAQISDRSPMVISSLTTALYPLSSEAAGNRQLVELRRLYLQAVQLLTWLSALLATFIVALAQDLLFLWVGPDFASRSWFVLATLAVIAVWRTPSTVAYQVYNGLGRTDIGIRLSLLYSICSTIAILLLTPIWGINGTAMALLIVTIPVALYADLLTQRKLLAQMDWVRSLSLYLKPWLVGCVLVLAFLMMPDMGSWLNLALKSVCIFCGFLIGLFFFDQPVFLEMRTSVLKLVHNFGFGTLIGK